MASAESNRIPTVSRVLQDGSLVELLYDPERIETSLAVGRPSGEVAIETHIDLPGGERLIPYTARNNLIATGCVLLPSAVGTYVDKATLLADIQAYLRRYVDLSPVFEAICAHYALLSWVYDAFNELPYLRFRGDYGTGKTRALLALGSICYKPFFASGASTVSPIFHVLDAFQGTLILDEADFRFTDATAGLTKILNNGTVAGLPVLRTMTNRHRELDPKAFRVFGPKLVGMRERFGDAALESRFLTEETGLRPLRPDVPIQLPQSLSTDALALRNKLLAWRFKERGRVATDPSRLAAGVEPRLNQTALSLLSIVDDPEVRQSIHDMLQLEDARVHQDRSASLEGAMVGVLAGLTRETEPAVSAIAERFNTAASGQMGRTVSPKWVGWFLRTRLRIATVKAHGVYVVQATERAKIAALAGRYGVAVTDAMVAAARPAVGRESDTAPPLAPTAVGNNGGIPQGHIAPN
jgi:hypothetical protein